MTPVELLLAKMPTNGSLKIPPPIMLDMGGEILSLDPQTQTASVRFPIQERYQNPLQLTQGGVIAAMIDNAVGPLSFIVAPPSVTKTMTVEYEKPITPATKSVVVNARVESFEGRKLTLVAEVVDEDNVVHARGRALQIILKEQK